MYPPACLTGYTRVYLRTRSYRHRMYARVCMCSSVCRHTNTYMSVCVCVCVCIDASMHTHLCVSCQKAGGPGGGGTFASRVCLFAPNGRAHGMDGMLRTFRFRAATAGRYYERLPEPLLFRRLPISQRCADRRLRPSRTPKPLLALPIA